MRPKFGAGFPSWITPVDASDGMGAGLAFAIVIDLPDSARRSTVLPATAPYEFDARSGLLIGIGCAQFPSIFKAAMKASCGISTLPNSRIFFLPAFCFSSSLRFLVMSPP